MTTSENKKKYTTRDITRPLSDEAKSKLADEVAVLQRRKELLEEEKSDSSKDFNARIKGKEERISDLCGRIRAGRENVTVSCYEVWDYALGEIRIEHAGTGEILERREMTGKERQQGLFDQEPPPASFSCLDHPPSNYPVRNYGAGLSPARLERIGANPRPEIEEGWVFRCPECGRSEYTDSSTKYPKDWKLVDREIDFVILCPECSPSTRETEGMNRTDSWKHRLKQTIIGTVTGGHLTLDGLPDPDQVKSAFGWPSAHEPPHDWEILEMYEAIKDELFPGRTDQDAADPAAAVAG